MRYGDPSFVPNSKNLGKRIPHASSPEPNRRQTVRALSSPDRLLVTVPPLRDLKSGLFGVLGTQFGGDGRTTFMLPKLAPLDGKKYIICIQGDYPRSP